MPSTCNAKPDVAGLFSTEFDDDGFDIVDVDVDEDVLVVGDNVAVVVVGAVVGVVVGDSLNVVSVAAVVDIAVVGVGVGVGVVVVVVVGVVVVTFDDASFDSPSTR